MGKSILHPTHFLCLPLVTSSSRPQLLDALKRLRSHVEMDSIEIAHLQMEDNAPQQPKRVPITAIRPVDTLHLTIGVLHETQLPVAFEVLQQLDLRKLLNENNLDLSSNDSPKESPKDEPLCVSLGSLKSMQAPDVTRTAVLYAAPHDTSNRLQAFSEALRQTFTDRKAMLPDRRPLLLHATLVNTIYIRGKDMEIMRRTPPSEDTPADDEADVVISAQDSPSSKQRAGAVGKSPQAGNTHRKKRGRKVTFDAQDILQQYSGQSLTSPDMPWRIESLAICKMGAQKYFEDGVLVKEAYVALADRNLP
jgi:activating signal cointegrator complex subunit 1